MNIPAAKIYFPPEDRAEILQRLDEALTTGQLTLGKYGKQLEERFAQFIGVKHAVAVNSGTSSLEICLRVLNVTGKTVLAPTNTFFATPAAVLHAGGNVRFVDADPETFALDVDSLLENITPETCGVIIVHIGGIVTPRMREIEEICRRHGLWLLEDAAHAHGSAYDGRMAGTFGLAASFSFYPTKVMTSGEGGMIVTNDDRIANEARLYRDQGKISFTQNLHDKLGYNWRMSEPHAILGLAQFQRLEEFIAVRQRTARIYDEGLCGSKGVTRVSIPTVSRSNYYKYMALLDQGIDRAALKRTLKQEYGVSLSGEVYELPCHRQPIFEELNEGRVYPKADDLCARHICLPLYATMTEAEACYVLSSLQKALTQLGG
ncbi:MAG: DegT/DnrJ/EryC1/StrS aminotransferase family protein [Caldilinea sp. CFX5]|nr:DegT/DnrJ/EryC1/StrS aminotransferase family protein [Caldilinea sp. CFX5]